MGLTYLELEVGNPATPDVTEKVEFLIDSGAIHSVVPAAALDRLGIKPLKERSFDWQMATGSGATKALHCFATTKGLGERT